MLKRILLFVVLPLGLFALAGYYWLGGFNQITIEVVKEPARPILGKHYQGQYGDLALRKIFVEAKQLQQSNTIQGLLTVVNLDSISANNQSINQLIGITLTDQSTTIPSGYQLDTIPSGTYVRATLQANPLVMPQPKTVNEQIAAYADEHQLTISGIPIEFYPSSGTLWIEMAIE